MQDEVERIAAGQPALERENGLFWCWIVWAMKSGETNPRVVAICTSEKDARRYEQCADAFPGCRLAAERAPLDHLFGAADLRSVAFRTSRRAHLQEQTP